MADSSDGLADGSDGLAADGACLAKIMAADELMQPPKGANGSPLMVDMRIAVFRIQKLDTAALTAEVKLAVVWYWTDVRMVGWLGRYYAPTPASLWGPDMFVVNRGQSWSFEQTQFDLEDSCTGRMKRAILYSGTVINHMDLADFPFDIDDVDVHMESVGHWSSNDLLRRGAMGGQLYQLREITQPKEGRLIGIYWDAYIPEWELLGCSLRIKQLSPNAQGSVRTSVNLRFHVARRWPYYFWKVLLPIAFLGGLSFKTFERGIDDIEGRNADVSTNFLSTFAMLYVLSTMLPTTDYLTRLDKFVVLTLMTIVATGVASSVLHSISATDSDRANDAGTFVVFAFLGIYLLGVLVIFIPPVWRYRSLRCKLLKHNSAEPVKEGALITVPDSARYFPIHSLVAKS